MGPRNASGAPLLAILQLVAANLLIPIAIGVFGKGFFPYKPLLPGLAHYEDHGAGPPAPAPFDRVVFMVVDALRSDFVYVADSGFQYTQSLIRSGAAIPFTAHATSPTVTMPRIKAITTGSIPSFLDVVLNVDEGDQSSSLASQDTWLAQMKAKGAGKLVLYGDDTWLKLFPDTFDRADGTSSFFVSDFTEVDHNVTRHVAGELRQHDWSVMVLHYLGLDHIGHKGGPRSPNMLPKQHEMDAIVRQVYDALDTLPHLASTLLVLCGDHGMNDAGNHGASSAGETSPALVFVAPALRSALPAAAPAGSGAAGARRTAPLDERDDFQFYRTVEQSDLAPTLAALLGFPVPKNNLGAFIPEFLALWPEKQHQVQILMHNARQILRILTAAFGAELFAEATPGSSLCADPPTDAAEIACAWQDIVRTVPAAAGEEAPEAYEAWVAKTAKWLRSAQRTMSGMASNYDMPKLGLGLAAAAAALALAGGASYMLLSPPEGAAGSDAGPACAVRTLAPFALTSVLYAVMMFASSYVEEEHHFWYWATSAWLALASVRSLSGPASRKGEAEAAGSVAARPPLLPRLVAVVAAFVAVRLIRGWNQTGQKFAGEPDLVKTFLQPNPLLLWTLVTSTYVLLGAELVHGFVRRAGYPAAAAVPAVTVLVLSAFSFKLVFTLEDSPELVGSFAQPLGRLLFRGSRGGGDASPLALTLVTRARIVFAGLAAAAAAATYAAVAGPRRQRQQRASPAASAAPAATPPAAPPAASLLLPIYTLLAATQSRTANIPLFLLFGVVCRFLAAVARRPPSQIAPAELTTATLLLQYASFFAFGGTNAISSVDLSSAYNGITGFSAGAVGVLLFLSNWAGAIYWAIAAALLLAAPRPPSPSPAPKSPWLQHAALLTVFAAASTVAVMAACTALRTHLFVWTVFSPKYLYCAAWNLGMHVGVNLGLGGLVYWLATLP